MNVFSLFENAVAAWGDRTAVRCGARRQTYRELDAATAAFAASGSNAGARKRAAWGTTLRRRSALRNFHEFK